MKISLVVELIVLVLVLTGFTVLTEMRSVRTIDENVTKHAEVVEQALWTLDSSTPEQYFPVVMDYEHIFSVLIEEVDGTPFLRLERPYHNRFERLWFEYLPHRTRRISRELTRDDMVLGRMTIELHSTNAGLYANFLIVLVLLYFLYRAYRRVLRAKGEIEAKSARLATSLDQLQSAQDSLVQAETQAALGRLVAGMAHEINTPLGTAYTSLTHVRDQLEDRDPSSPQLSLMDMAISSLRRTGDLVRTFKMVSVDPVQDQPQSFDLSEYLDALLVSLRNEMSQSDVHIEFRPEGPVPVLSNPGVLLQVTTQILTNARIHAFRNRSDRRILVTTGMRDDGQAEVVFQDNGVGMDADTRRRLFDPFYVGHRAAGGVGLGMHIVYNLVAQGLKGRIECDSAPERGTRFIIRFPAGR